MRLLLLHSPLVGPASFGPLAVALAAKGIETILPDLRPALSAPAPYWRAWSEAAAAASEGLSHDIVLIGHSGAGRLLPAVGASLRHPPTAYVFLDAGLPYDGESHLTRAPAAFRDLVTSLTAPDGHLPTWTSWWPEPLLSRLLPDASQRAALASDCPRVPAALLDEPIPVPDAWPDAPCLYISFTYEEEAAEAEARGWPVLRLSGTHLALATEPVPVRDAIVDGLQALLRR